MSKILTTKDGKVLTSNDKILNLTIEDTLGAAIAKTLTHWENSEFTSIDTTVFKGNTNLETIELPNAITVGTSCFEDCSKLREVKMQELQEVGEKGFYNAALEELDMPKLKTIKRYGFNGNKIKNLYLPQLEEVAGDVFGNNKELEKVYLPKLKIVNNNAFYGCSNLKIVILDEVTELKSYAFYGIFNLDTLVIRTDSTSITIPSSYLFSQHYYCFKNIYFQDHLVEHYKSATNWSNYASYIKPLSELPNEIKEEFGL